MVSTVLLVTRVFDNLRFNLNLKLLIVVQGDYNTRATDLLESRRSVARVL